MYLQILTKNFWRGSLKTYDEMKALNPVTRKKH